MIFFLISIIPSLACAIYFCNSISLKSATAFLLMLSIIGYSAYFSGNSIAAALSYKDCKSRISFINNCEFINRSGS